MLVAAVAALLPGQFDAACAAVSVQPAQLSIEAGGRQRFIVTVTGPSAALRKATLEIVTPPGVLSRARPAASVAGSKTWLVDLEVSSTVAIEAPVFVLARVAGKLETGIVTVAPKAAPPAASQLSAELLFDRDTLLDGEAGRILLAVTNLSDTPLKTVPSFLAPPYLRITYTCPPNKPRGCPDEFWTPARSTRVFSFRLVTAGSAEHPLSNGKHMVTALVTASRDGGKAPWSGSIAVSQPLTVGVPGLSEVQAIIQVPSFLLLPGFLICTVFLMTWRFWRPAPAAGADGLPGWLSVALSPAVWVLAITASFLVVWIYPSFTDLLGLGRREILFGFELADVMRIWLGSILLGFLLGSAALTLDNLIAAYRHRNDYKFSDSPLNLLEKMSAKGQPLVLPYKVVGTNERLYALDALPASGDIWATTSILYLVADSSFDEAALAKATAGQAIEPVLGLLKMGVETGALTVTWGTYEGKVGPRLIGAAQFDRPAQKESLVQPG